MESDVKKAYCSPYSSSISLFTFLGCINASSIALVVYTVLFTMGPFTASFSYSFPFRLDASGYLLVPISFVFRYGTLHKMNLNMHTDSSTRPLVCLFPLNFPSLLIIFTYL